MRYTRSPLTVTFPEQQDPRARLVIRGGRLVDPAHRVDAFTDLAIAGGRVAEVAETIQPERGDRLSTPPGSSCSRG